jgi:hypothetical protein
MIAKDRSPDKRRSRLARRARSAKIAAMQRRSALATCSLAGAALAGAALSGPASASGPRLTVAAAKLRAGLVCEPGVAHASRTPLMLVPGTGVTGEQLYTVAKPSLDAYGHPACYVNLPHATAGDMQVAVEYVVHGLRREFELAHRKVAVYGISQGALLPRFALLYWPDLRRKVGDVLAAAGTQHGTTVRGADCSATSPCAAALWQQAAGSALLRAINSQPDETPGAVSYTTVRTLTDETVQPQTGSHASSALDGASNIVIQDVCPGRTTTHVGTAADSVTFAALVEAVRRRGPGRSGAAKASRLPADVCDHPYATGLDPAVIDGFFGAAGGLIGSQIAAAPKVAAEPKVRAVFKRRR